MSFLDSYCKHLDVPANRSLSPLLLIWLARTQGHALSSTPRVDMTKISSRRGLISISLQHARQI